MDANLQKIIYNNIKTYIHNFNIVIVTKPKFITLAFTNYNRHLIRKLLYVETVLSHDTTRYILE